MSELIYGRHAVLETLRADRRRLYRLWVEGDANQQHGRHRRRNPGGCQAQQPARALHQGRLVRQARAASRPMRRASRWRRAIIPMSSVEDCLALAKQRQEPPLLLILDHLQDPQNLGTLIRTAEAMGVHGILIPDRRAARITPAVSNASAGAVEHLRVAQVTNLNRTIDELKEQQHLGRRAGQRPARAAGLTRRGSTVRWRSSSAAKAKG